MIATLVQKGDAIDFIAPADVARGDVVVVGELVGIAQNAVKAGETGAMAVTGVYELPKATGGSTALAAGTKVNWDANNKVVTTAAGPGGANKFVGKTILPAAADDTTARVRLSQ